MRFESILKKLAMGVTGLGLAGFLVGHLSGNFLLFKGAEPFNAYAEFLASLGGGLILAELGLAFFLAVHVVSAIAVTRQNRAARPQGYAMRRTKGESTLASRSMAVGGIIILVFVITHIKMFKFGDTSGPDGLFGLVMRSFANPAIALWYVAAMIPLGLHLSHGASSALQTLGLNRPTLRTPLRQAGRVVGWAIALGFGILPIWAFIQSR